MAQNSDPGTEKHIIYTRQLDRQLSGYADTINVLDFGADPSGRTLSTLAFQKAIQSIYGVQGHVYVPGGTYLIDEPIELHDNLLIRGQGKKSVLRITNRDMMPHKLGHGIFHIDGIDGLIFRNLCFDVNASDNFSKSIRIRRSSNILIQQCDFINSNAINVDKDWTIMAVDARDIKNCTIVENESVGCQFKLAGGSGFAENIVFKNNTISECTQMGLSIVATVMEKSVTIKNIKIVDNKFSNIDNHCIYLGYDSGRDTPTNSLKICNILIQNNHMLDLGYHGSKNATGCLIRFDEGDGNLIIMDNTIVNSLNTKFSRGIDIKAAPGKSTLLKSVVIKNNQIRGMQVASIMIDHIKDAKIQTNQCYGGTRSIQMYDCQEIEVSNNRVSDNGWALEIHRSHSLNILDNKITNAKIGIKITGQRSAGKTSDIVEGNIIKECETGIYIGDIFNYSPTINSNTFNNVRTEIEYEGN